MFTSRWSRPVLLGVIGTLVVLFGKDTVVGVLQALTIFVPVQ